MYKEITKANIKTQEKRINTQVWTKGDILAFAKLLNSYRFSSPERKNQIMNLWSNLEDRTCNIPYDITKDQSDFGLQWLNKICFTSKGKNRDSKMVQDFNSKDFDIVRNFHHFEFVGFHEASNGYNSHCAPIYRTIDKDGNYFDYVARMWQAPEIVGRGKCEILTPLHKVC